MFAIIHRIVWRRIGRTAGFHNQMWIAYTIGTQDRIHHTHFFRCRFEQHSTTGIAEQRTGRTILIVRYSSHFIACHNNHFLIASRTDIIGTCFQGIQKTGTSPLQIESHCILATGMVSYNGGSSREMMVRRSCCCEDHFYLFRVHICLFE